VDCVNLILFCARNEPQFWVPDLFKLNQVIAKKKFSAEDDRPGWKILQLALAAIIIAIGFSLSTLLSLKSGIILTRNNIKNPFAKCCKSLSE